MFATATRTTTTAPLQNVLTPLVVVHGLLGDFRLPKVLAEMDALDVFAPDLLGYGEYVDVDPRHIDLAAQVRHVMRLGRSRFGNRPFHLAGHSIGGVITALMADSTVDGCPGQILSLTNIEGNFTLRDAFWSAGVARMTTQEAGEMLDRLRGNPRGWLNDCGITPDEERIACASGWLTRQPATTLQAMARSVVAVTGDVAYQHLQQRVFARLPVALLVGARSRKDWDLPAWAEQAATELTLMDNAGHMMMLDDPSRFGMILGDIVARQALRVND